MKQEYRVELWVNTVGETPESKVIKHVLAEDKDDALIQAREMLKTEDPELNHLKIDTWFVERTYS